MFEEKQGIKVSPQDIYQLQRGKTVTSPVGKPGRNHLNQVIEVNITSNKTYRHHAQLIRCTEEDRVSLMWSSLPKMHNLNLTMRKHQQPKLRDILQNN